MAPSFEGLPERQGQSCGLDEPDLGTLKGLQFRAHQIKRLGKLFLALLTLFNYEDLAWYSSQPSKAFWHWKLNVMFDSQQSYCRCDALFNQLKSTWGWNRIASKGHFQQREPERPEIGCHAVLGALQPLWGHIGPGSHKAVCHRVDQLPRNAKVTDFDLPSRVHKYVARLDIPVKCRL